jgi:putative copper export protein
VFATAQRRTHGGLRLMRFAVLGVLAVIALLASAVAGLVLADPSLENLRDLVIVVYGVMGILLVIALIVVSIGLWLAVRILTRTLNELLREQVRPTLDEVQATARNVRGTSEFIADSTVSPLIRAVAVVRGVRRGLGRVTNVVRRRR